MLWLNERAMPEELVALINNPYTPERLRADLLTARREIEQTGAVGYVTKGSIERGLHNLSDKQRAQIQSDYDHESE